MCIKMSLLKFIKFIKSPCFLVVMTQGIKINFYVGLLKADMTTPLNIKDTITLINKELIKINVLGYNVQELKGYWNSKPEPCLKVSFINTFNVKPSQLKTCVETLKALLEQESILIEFQTVQYTF